MAGENENQVVEEVIEPAPVDNTTEPEPVEPAEGGEANPAAEPVNEEPPKKPKIEPWYMKRINQQNAKISALSRGGEATVAELAAARAELDSLKAARSQDPANAERQPEPARSQESLTQAQINARAQEIVAAQRFNEACDRVYSEGSSQFEGFDDAVRTLGATGIMTPPFLEAVTSLDNAAKVLNHLGTNPEEANRIGSLPTAKQAIELAKLDLSVGKVAPRQTSKAPAPIRPVGGAARTTTELSDEMDDAAWIALRRAQKAKRNA